MKIEVVMKKTKVKVDAKAIYDSETKEMIVKKGSIVSEDVSQAKTFRGAKSILKAREGVIGEGCKLLKDVSFKISSTAGNFVTGRSTDGLSSWKTLDGKKLKEVL